MIVSDQRAITVDDSDDGNALGATTIINEGTIQGGNEEAISITGSFADTITNKGTIIGGSSPTAAMYLQRLYRFDHGQNRPRRW